MSTATAAFDDDAARRAKRVREIVAAVIQARQNGQVLPDEKIISLYPELTPLLAEELHKAASNRTTNDFARPAETGPDATASVTQTPLTDIAAENLTRLRALLEEDTRTHLTETNADLPSDLSLSRMIPGYEIIQKLSGGGQAVVYLAIQKALGRTVAIKVMRRGPFSDLRTQALFEQEARVLAQLNHPAIVTIHDSGMARAGTTW